MNFALQIPDEISPREENITTYSGLSLVGLLLSKHPEEGA